MITLQDFKAAMDNNSLLGDFFDFPFPTAMNNAESIHFNLQGIANIDEAVRLGAMGRGFTNTELYLILHNREWFNKTTFYNVPEGEVLRFLGD